MSQEIRINYEEVYSKTAELRQRIQSELQEMEGAYRQAGSTLHSMDSRTNAVIIESMEANRIKAQVTAETLTKLLSFIDTAAKQVERDESTIARSFNQTRVRTARRGGAS